jgi:hypothetical protein
MARGEAFITCAQCGAQSRIPVMALQRDNYYCSKCGNRIPLSSINLASDNGSQPASRAKARKPFQRHKRR